MHNGYKIEDGKVIVFVDLYEVDGEKWWENEDMLIFVLSHEAGHAIYSVDAELRFDFREQLMQRMMQRTEKTELQEYVEEYYPFWLWDGEMFAYKFQGWAAGVDEWCGTKITTDLIKSCEYVRNWINE